MSKVARLTAAELRRAVKVADETGKRLAVRPDGTLVFEDKQSEGLIERPDWNRPSKHVAL